MLETLDYFRQRHVVAAKLKAVQHVINFSKDVI